MDRDAYAAISSSLHLVSVLTYSLDYIFLRVRDVNYAQNTSKNHFGNFGGYEAYRQKKTRCPTQRGIFVFTEVRKPTCDFPFLFMIVCIYFRNFVECLHAQLFPESMNHIETLATFWRPSK